MLRKAIAYIFLSILPAFSYAALIDSDSTTLDTDTGLSWLDLKETYNFSYDDVVSLTSAGAIFSGYRHATKAEVRQLFSNAGIIGVANGVNDFNYESTKNLVRLLSGGTHNNRYLGGMSAFEATPLNVSYSEISEIFSVWVEEDIKAGTTGVSITDSRAFSAPNTGHFLVSTVPVPAAAWFFGSALLGLAGIKRKKSLAIAA